MHALFDRGPAAPLSSLYLHVPFCRDRCSYCAFATIADDPSLHAEVVDGLLAELRRWGEAPPWKTVYLGGGTPGLVNPELLERLLDGVGAKSASEVTLEVNPVNVTEESLLAWEKLGITRLSIGVQTFDDAALRRLARRHDGTQAQHALQLVGEGWAGHWSADLLIGWPEQTHKALERDLDTLLALNPPHLSLYGLEVESGTTLEDQIENGSTRPLKDHQRHSIEIFLDYQISIFGLSRYEISNYSRSGQESLHNKVYWANSEYLGLGPGACSSIGHHRWSNERDTRRWLKSVGARESCRASAELLSPSARLLESLAVGLRQADGIPRQALEDRYGPAWVEALPTKLLPLEELGLQLDGERLRVADLARDRLDGLMRHLAQHWPEERGRPR